MKVAFATDGLFPHSVGGMQRHTSFLADALVSLGVDVDVYAPAGQDAAGRRFRVVEVEWPRVPVYSAALRAWAGRLAPRIAAGGYDVVYVQGLTLWGLLPGTVFNPHGLEMCVPDTRLNALRGWPLRVAARREARVAARVISLGGTLTDLAERCLDVDRSRIAVVPNGVDTDYFRPAADGRREPGLVLFVGRFFHNKGIDRLLEAFARVDAPGARLVLVGSGPLRAQLESARRDERVEFRGDVTEDGLAELYRRAQALVVPSRSDGMPTVILEAFACGTPAIASDVGAVSELVDDETGILVRPGDADALVAALERAVRGELTAQGAAARRRAEARFSWPAVARRTLDVLEDVVSGR